MNPHSIITILTDFGTRDGFIGVMKGVMLQICPQARFVDISHDLPHFSVSAAAFLNEWAFGYFSTGTVHLCVVDPGVGTRRRVLAIECAGHYFVGPDNGLFTPIFQSGETCKIIHATNSDYWLDKISNTFHGRDIFSPIAAHLARGVEISNLGQEVNDPILINSTSPAILNDRIHCAVRYIDKFGNLVTDLAQEQFTQWCVANNITQNDVIISWTDHQINGICNAYGDKERGELLAVFNGFDKLEVSVSGGNAASTTGLGIGDKIIVEKQ